MNKFSRQVCIAVLAPLLLIGILYAKALTDSVEPKPRILIETMIVQVSRDTLDKLQVGRNMEPASKVTVPLASLLYVLADPNAAKVIAKPKLMVWAGQTGKVTVGQKLKYLVKRNNGSFEQKTTDMPVGTTLEATPTIGKDGDILLNFKFEHFSVAPSKEIDPQTFLPIGEPLIGIQSVNSRLKLKPDDPVIAGGGIDKSGAQFILVRVEILEQPAKAQ